MTAPGWYPDPTGGTDLRWWDGITWTPYTSRRRGRPVRQLGIGLLGAALLVLVGLSSLGWAALGHWPRVTVSPINAVVVEPLSAQDCSKGHPLEIAIAWHGQTVRVEDDGPSCDISYRPGQDLTVWSGSDGPNDIGPDANWILNPDTHDPFAVFGPNSATDFLFFVGFLFVTAGCVAASVMWHRARKPRWDVAWQARQVF